MRRSYGYAVGTAPRVNDNDPIVVLRRGRRFEIACGIAALLIAVALWDTPWLRRSIIDARLHRRRPPTDGLTTPGAPRRIRQKRRHRHRVKLMNFASRPRRRGARRTAVPEATTHR
jgi:hypothetical protein